jgi:hypothetical protein
MPVKRRAGKRREHLVTPAAIAAFQANDRAALHRILDLRPWHASPLFAVGACPWPPGTAGSLTWDLVTDLRAEILEAIDASQA